LGSNKKEGGGKTLDVKVDYKKKTSISGGLLKVKENWCGKKKKSPN